MPVKIRLQRKGRKQAPFYHIVAANARSPRDGRFIEKIGTYNPLTVPATIDLNVERADYWLGVGAQPTDTVRAILRYKGVLYYRHLVLGVKKGALTQEEADAKFKQYLDEKENRLAANREATAEKKRQMLIAIDGKPRVKAAPEPEPVVEETPAEESAVEATAESAAEEVVAEDSTPAIEDASAAEPAEEEKTEE